jgi:parvulin-like peptidyl-prolyl isomerase
MLVEATPPAAPPPTVFQPSQIIAWVGDQPIQAGDVMPMIEQALAPELAKLDAEALEAQKEQIDQRKQEFMKQALEGMIEVKLLYLDFLRNVPADKKKEVLPKVQSRAEEEFYETHLPELMKTAKVETAAELDALLRRYGSSLEEKKRTYIERMLGRSMLGQNIDREPEITHQEMLDYYHQNLAKFEYPAQARWEKLTVKFDQFPTKPEAWAALGDLGNQVLRGAPFEAVARRYSQGVDAPDGGHHDWTTKGSLASETLDVAIFNLPVGQLSERLEDKEGFHIVRVLERRDAGRTSFLEAQIEIKETLKDKRMRADISKYVAKLRTQIRVWTIYDEPPPGNPG